MRVPNNKYVFGFQPRDDREPDDIFCPGAFFVMIDRIDEISKVREGKYYDDGNLDKEWNEVWHVLQDIGLKTSSESVFISPKYPNIEEIKQKLIDKGFIYGDEQYQELCRYY